MPGPYSKSRYNNTFLLLLFLSAIVVWYNLPITRQPNQIVSPSERNWRQELGGLRAELMQKAPPGDA